MAEVWIVLNDESQAYEFDAESQGSLAGAAIRGTSWSSMGAIVSIGAQVVYTAVMGRLLTPTEFGTVAAATVLMVLASLISQAGIQRAVIQAPSLTKRQVTAAHGISILFGVCVSTVLLVAAPLVRTFSDAPNVVAVTQVQGAIFAIHGLGVVAQGLLRRRLKFRQVAIIAVGADISSFAFGIGLAVAGFGVWSIVAANVLQATVLSIGSVATARFWRLPSFELSAVRRLMGFGLGVTGVSLLEYATLVAPDVFVSRFLGPAALGNFTRATMLVRLPSQRVAETVTAVMMPTLSHVQEDRARFARGYQAAFSLVCVITIPLAAVLAVAADLVIPFLLGDGWDDAASVLPWLSVAVAFAVLASVPAIALEAANHLRPKVLLEILRLVVYLIAFGLLSGRTVSLVEVALVVVALEAMRLVFYVTEIARHVSMPVGPLVRSGAEAVVLAAVAAAVMALILGWYSGSLFTTLLLGGLGTTLACAGLAAATVKRSYVMSVLLDVRQSRAAR